jgi:DnaK suppressor protein
MPTEFESVRQKLEQQKQELLVRAAKVHADITRSSGPLDKDFAEQVVQMENDAVLAGIGEATAAELAQINRALAQMDAGSYGTCSRCGQPINERRLQALPYSDRCITCAEAAS